jgi:hypothetical protein
MGCSDGVVYMARSKVNMRTRFDWRPRRRIYQTIVKPSEEAGEDAGDDETGEADMPDGDVADKPDELDESDSKPGEARVSSTPESSQEASGGKEASPLAAAGTSSANAGRLVLRISSSGNAPSITSEWKQSTAPASQAEAADASEAGDGVAPEHAEDGGDETAGWDQAGFPADDGDWQVWYIAGAAALE